MRRASPPPLRRGRVVETDRPAASMSLLGAAGASSKHEKVRHDEAQQAGVAERARAKRPDRLRGPATAPRTQKLQDHPAIMNGRRSDLLLTTRSHPICCHGTEALGCDQ